MKVYIRKFLQPYVASLGTRKEMYIENSYNNSQRDVLFFNFIW